MSDLDGRRVMELELVVPPAGSWFATLTLQSGDTPAPGPCRLTVGTLALVGRVLGRGGLDSPSTPSVVVSGGPGWRTRLPAGAYTSTNGVRLSTVLEDLAKACGEAYDAPAEAQLGREYGWSAGTRARAVLADLVARGAVPTWRVAPTGRTRFDAWPALGAADAAGVVLGRDLARGVRTIGLDSDAAAWMPGASVQGVQIARARFHEVDSTLRAEVWES